MSRRQLGYLVPVLPGCKPGDRIDIYVGSNEFDVGHFHVDLFCTCDSLSRLRAVPDTAASSLPPTVPVSAPDLAPTMPATVLAPTVPVPAENA
eukprot:CAMPEP_0119152050 /NCGR_PEP_ID=MMETSP1310-20130426/47194_1 /TAXON_ID=464262 /ORGANISM="Genus nov. species nov., Strain RCC2339" /LENGTH=92 /DNA_ID=CAMNT_0007144381 /DNA_START=23 /DNA_END=298 /DNA_ORIENTATION=-